MDAWAVGSGGAPSEGKVYHYTGTTWVAALSGVPPLRSVSALDPAHAWVVGAAGNIRFWDGSAWHDQSVGGTEDLNSVFALDAGHVWAAGQSGKVLFFNGTDWSATSLGAVELKSVTAIDARHAWAVGASGAIFAWDGTSWLDQSIAGAQSMNGVSALDSNYVWTAGDGGQIKFWDGYSWKNRAVPAVTEKMFSIFALDVDHVFAASVSGHVYFFNGASWQLLATSTARDLFSVTALDTDHIFLVGGNGTFVWMYSNLCAQSSKFYFAEGTCRPAFDAYLCVQNPDEAIAASVKISYILGDGRTVPQTVSVPPLSRATVTVKDVLGSGEDAAHDFSAVVECTGNIPIIAERPMYFAYQSGTGPVITGGSDVVGAPRPRPTWYFAEGSCRPAFDPYICILNPGAAASNVKIDYMLGNGDSKEQGFSVPAHARRTVNVKDLLGQGNDAAHDFSARVGTTDGTDIVAERPMYFAYVSFSGALITGGHDVIGAATPAKDFYFAEGRAGRASTRSCALRTPART